tara:strand:- start:6243 stop:9500 length:3258 start_codon:yes stop_codon:yes gene_type:complete
MLNKRNHKLLAYLLFFSSLLCQTFTSIDTIYQDEYKKYYKLKNKLIIRSSLKVRNNDILINPIHVDSINGLIYLAQEDFKSYLIAEYNYLKNIFPLQVGPLWKSLPLISGNEIIINEKKQSLENTSIYNQDFFSSGSFNRELNFSPQGGSDFSGGFQMQFNGKLSNDINVQGVITDQSIPFQPEGTTRKLEELDKVYINIVHPNFSFNIGDVNYQKNIGDQLSISRKLTGMKNKFSINKWEGKSIFANSQGKYNRKEEKGRDGVQGPYYLISKDGNKNIIILSGTEEVWLDGKKLIRGHNNDYVIDYSMAEVNFTANHLIHSDSDILFKYEYSDFNYNQSFNGTSIKKKYNGESQFEIGFFRELDNISKDSSSNELKSIFSNLKLNKIQFSTVVIDPNGDYKKNGDVFIYSPNESADSLIKYSVLFEYNENGNYKKKVSINGRIYYEYISLNDKEPFEDYYSPFRILSSPKSHNYGFIKNNFKLNNFLNIDSYFTGSEFDKNILYIGNGTKDYGFSYNIKSFLDPFTIGFLNLEFFYIDQKRSQNYQELGSKNEIRQKRFWNLDSNIIKGVHERSILTKVNIENISRTKLSYSKFKTNFLNRSKLNIDQLFISPFFQNSFINFTSVNGGDHDFFRIENQFQFNLKKISPFVKYMSEKNELQKAYNYVGAGFIKENFNSKIETGISNRKDNILYDSLDLSQSSDDLIAFFEFKDKLKDGFNKNLILKKRIKTFSNNFNKDSYNYSLLNLSLSYNKNSNPLEWRINSNIEESLIEKRTIIYDSVGVGLGNYRYDKNINTYIRDENGQFVSYVINMGNFEPSTLFESSQNFNYNLGIIDLIPNILLRGNSKQKLRGSKINFSNIFNPNINIDDLLFLNTYSRYEILINGDIRILGWNENSTELNGLDYNGKNLISNREFGIKVNKNIFKNFSIENHSQYKTNKNESNYDILRNRSLTGVWNETSFNINIVDNGNVNFVVLYGYDNGSQIDVPFKSKAIGFKVTGKTFFNKNGRIESEISYINGVEKNKIVYIPPEALNGNPLGNSLKTFTQFQYFINQSVSMIYSLNTINNARYKNLISFKGEIRAYF